MEFCKKKYIFNLSTIDIGFIFTSYIGVFCLGRLSSMYQLNKLTIINKKQLTNDNKITNEKHLIKIFQKDKDGHYSMELFIKYIPEYKNGILEKIFFPNHTLEDCLVTIKCKKSNSVKDFFNVTGKYLKIEDDDIGENYWINLLNLYIHPSL